MQIDSSMARLNLKAALIRGQVELVEGKVAAQGQSLYHLKYVTQDVLNDPCTASYLSRGDDVTVKVHMDRLISCCTYLDRLHC